jgi:hypothetical protein
VVWVRLDRLGAGRIRLLDILGPEPAARRRALRPHRDRLRQNPAATPRLFQSSNLVVERKNRFSVGEGSVRSDLAATAGASHSQAFKGELSGARLLK